MNIFNKTLIASSVILASTSAFSAGLYLHEVSTNDVGLAAAGKAARAQDASVMAANPAGLSNVDGKSFTGGLTALYGDADYQMDDGRNAGNIVGFVPLGSAFYSQQINDRFTLGIGVYGNYGLGLDYDNVPVETAVTQALTIQPTASYKINDQWAVGAGLGIQYGMFDLKAGTTAGDIIPSGSEVDDTDIAYNAKLGLLFSPNADTRFGLGYSSETELNFEVSALGKTVPMSSLMPQTLTFSAFHQLNDKLAVMGNLDWEDWSAYTTTTGAPTQDTYHIAIGSRYQLNEKTIWNLGIAYDSSLYKSQSEGDLTLPTGNTWRIGTGAEYQLDNSNSIGVAFEVALVDSSEVPDKGKVDYSGHFTDPALYFLTMTYSWSGQ